MDDCESPITPIFISKLEKKLNARNTHVSKNKCKIIYSKVKSNYLNLLFLIFLQTPNNEFTMDEKFVHPLKVVYKYDEIKLEEIHLPSILNLDELLTKI